MKKYEIKNFRMNLGKFLHDYYVKFGEEKYEKFLEKLGPALEEEYGDFFSSDNMRIMEAEFVTLSSKLSQRHMSDEEKCKKASHK